MLGAAGDRRDRETAGVGEQVEHALAARMLLYPAAPIAHVEEQPIVLLAPQIQLVVQAVLTDPPLRGHVAEQCLGRRLRQVAVLQQEVLNLPLLPCRGLSQRPQHPLQRLQLRRTGIAKQRHQQHTLQPVDSQLFQPRIAAAPPVKQPPCLLGRSGQGVEQVSFEDREGGGGHGVGILAAGRAF